MVLAAALQKAPPQASRQPACTPIALWDTRDRAADTPLRISMLQVSLPPFPANDPARFPPVIPGRCAEQSNNAPDGWPTGSVPDRYMIFRPGQSPLLRASASPAFQTSR